MASPRASTRVGTKRRKGTKGPCKASHSTPKGDSKDDDMGLREECEGRRQAFRPLQSRGALVTELAADAPPSGATTVSSIGAGVRRANFDVGIEKTRDERRSCD